jgi:hypothetical protein
VRGGGSPQGYYRSTEKTDLSGIDWGDLEERIREAVPAVIRERADELSLSWDNYGDRLHDHEHCQEASAGPAS